MRKNNQLFLKTGIGYSFVFISLSFLFICASCDKSHDSFNLGNAILVSETGDINEPIDELELSADGTSDTIYVFSNSEISVSVNGARDWVKIIKEEYKQDLKATMVVLAGDTLENDLSKRIGELDISNETMYSRKFLKLVQGYDVHFTENFSWLHYGHGNPLYLDEGVLINDWNPSQKEYGWISDTLQGESTAYLYGKDGYVQLGSDAVGANLSTPIVSGVQGDSLLILTFDAVAFVSEEGVKDDNKLTIEIEGGEFEDGGNQKVIDLSYIDNESALVTTKMWENAFYKFVLAKHQNNPYSTTIQIRFINGDKIASAENRIFLDNIRLFSKAQYHVDKESEE